MTKGKKNNSGKKWVTVHKSTPKKKAYVTFSEEVFEKPLPFPLKQVTEYSQEYEIPMADKPAVLKKMDALNSGKMGEMRFCLHEEKLFKVDDFKVVRENDINYLVSPYYYSSGGTLIDWMPAEWAERLQEATA